MSRSTAEVAQPKLMTLDEWSRLDEDVEGELVGGVLAEDVAVTSLPRRDARDTLVRVADDRYSVARTASTGRVRIPGCRGLVFDLEDLWEEIDQSEREESRAGRRQRP